MTIPNNVKVDAIEEMLIELVFKQEVYEKDEKNGIFSIPLREITDYVVKLQEEHDHP